MKSPRLKEDLVPVQELRSQLARFIDLVSETSRPVVVTQRGRAAAVLVSPAMLDEIEAERELVRQTLRGLRDLKAGRIVDAEPLLRKDKKRRASGDEARSARLAGSTRADGNKAAKKGAGGSGVAKAGAAKAGQGETGGAAGE